MRVLTWNIWNGGGDRLGAIEDVLRAQDADAIALQEVTDPEAGAWLADRLGLRFTFGEANSEWGVAWLTREPVVRSDNHRMQLAKTLLEIEYGGLRLYATHLVHGRDEAAAELRVEEVRSILTVVARAEPHVVVGDFNAVHPRDAVGAPPPDEEREYVARRPIELMLEAGYIDCFRSLHSDDGWTYVAWHPWARIDFVFARGITPQRCEVVAAGRASDHLPVVSDFPLTQP